MYSNSSSPMTDSSWQSKESTWKSKESSFKKQSTHSSKQNTLQSLRYLNFSELIDWRLNLTAFQTKVANICNYYTILNTLFTISEEMDWRLYIGHMNLLISKFHNIMCDKKGSSLQDISKIPHFQHKFEKLFLLKDLTLHKHLMLLLKMLLAFNPKYSFLKQTTFSLILIESATYNDPATITEIVWILAQINLSSDAFIKLIKHEGLSATIDKGDTCLLPLLTIVANFLANPNQDHHVVEQLVTSNMFQRIFQMGLASGTKEVINETVLMFNNGVCFSPAIRNILLKNQDTIGMVMAVDCPEKDKFKEVITILQFQSQINFSAQSLVNSQYSM